jgi:hypothetical protein
LILLRRDDLYGRPAFPALMDDRYADTSSVGRRGLFVARARAASSQILYRRVNGDAAKRDAHGNKAAPSAILLSSDTK